MVTIAIIATIVAISLPFYKNMTREAKRTEAKLNVRTLSMLGRTFISDGGSLGNAVPVSLDNFESETSCVLANPVGFKQTDCRKINYVYYLTAYVDNVDSSYAIATEGKLNGEKRLFPECTLIRDTWHGDAGGRLFNATDMKKYCSSNIITLIMSNYGSTNPIVDLDGDGDVDGSDFLIAQRIF